MTGSTTASNRRREQEGGKLHWDDIKRTALQATALADGGVRLTLDRVARLVQRDPSVEVHLVGHSAGAILLAPAAQLLTSAGRITSGPMKGRKGLDVTVHSCTLWAPACTTDLFHRPTSTRSKNGASASS